MKSVIELNELTSDLMSYFLEIKSICDQSGINISDLFYENSHTDIDNLIIQLCFSKYKTQIIELLSGKGSN